MKFSYAFAFFLLLSVGAHAQGEPPRIPDLSLSPEETNELIANPPASASSYSPYGNQFFNNHTAGTERLAPHAARFMDSYCDTNFKPLLGEADNCVTQERQSICQRFQALPADAQQLVDQIASCSQNLVQTDGNADKACAASSDASRVALLKKYQQDSSVMKALLSLPDEVVNSGNCVNGNR